MKELKEKLVLKEMLDEYEIRDQVEELGLDDLSKLIDKYSSCCTQGKCYKVGRQALHLVNSNRDKIGDDLYRELLHYFDFYTKSLEKSVLKEDEEEKLHDVTPDEPIVVSTKVEDKKQETLENNGIAGLINSLILDEFNAVEMYNSAISTLTTMESKNKDKVIAIINDILDEENVHIGQLQEVLKLVQPSAEKIEDGKEEAQDTLASTEAPIEQKDEIPQDDDKKED